ncbi:hypothetical protein Tco_0970068 [Tanacetum coccineum]
MDSGRSGNDTDADDVRDLDPIYDEEPMAEVQLTAECNIFAIGQQHTEQPEIINEGRVDQYPETCQVKSPMLDSSPDNQTTEYSKQSLESENILLKKTVAQFQKDFSRMEAHCIALELKYQNQSLKSGQHGQILNETSNKAKIEKEIDVLETMNIELEHSVAKLHLQKRWFSLVKSSAVYEEITSSRFDLRWKTLTGKIFKTVGLRNSARNGLQKDELHQMTLSQNSSGLRSYALSWKPCQGDSLNLPDHRAQVDQGSQIKMIQVKEMMQDNDLKNSKSKDKGSKSRSQSMDEQSHYKQDKTITRQSINVKRHIFNVIGGTEEFEERDLNIGGDC